MAGPHWHLADDRKTVTVSFPSHPPVALKLESRDTRGLLGKLFGKGSVAALLLSFLLIGGTAWAASKYTTFGIVGQGCGSWTVQQDNAAGRGSTPEYQVAPARLQFQSWLGGYLTAYSHWVENGSGPVSDSVHVGAIAWVDNYCQENPLKHVSQAAEALLYAIKAK